MINEIINKWVSGVDWNKKLLAMSDVSIRLLLVVLISLLLGRLAGRILVRLSERYAESGLFPFNRSLVKKNVIQ